MTRFVFDTAQVAHIWAQGRQDSGRNSARRVFFEGAKLFSYGQHFLTAYRLPDGAAFLNSGRYSVSTSRHQQDARRAVTGRGFQIPANLMNNGNRGYNSGFPLPDFMDSRVFALPQYVTREGAIVDSPFNSEGQYITTGRADPPSRPATREELKAARRDLLKLFLDCEETAPAESIVAAFTYAGAKHEEAAKAAAKVAASHAKRAADQKEQDAATKKKQAESWAIRGAALSLDTIKGEVEKARVEVATHNWRGSAERQAAGLLGQATQLFKARKAAKARGWTRLCADLKAREDILRAGAKGLESYSGLIARLKFWKESKATIRAGLACLPCRDIVLPGEDDSAKVWTSRVHAARRLASGIKEAQAGSSHWLFRRAKVAGADLARMGAGLAAILAAFEERQGKAQAGAEKAALRGKVAALRAFKVAGAGASLEVAKRAAEVAGRFALVTYGNKDGFSPSLADHRPKIPGAFALAGWTPEAFKTIQEKALARIPEARKEEEAAKIEAWRAGGLPAGRTQDAEGGALIRATGVKRNDSGAIIGGRLQTSWGAEVALPEAIKAFRFLKLCKDSGRDWKANGRILEVGAFRVDWVDSSGNFTAGCHRINWPEVAALAARLGVADLAPADTTQEREKAEA